MLSKAALRKQLDELKRDVARVTGGPTLLIVDIPDKECPLPAFERASAEVERKWPGTSVVAIRCYGYQELPDEPAPVTTRQRPWEAAKAALEAAIRADMLAWFESEEYRTWLAAQVQAHIESAWNAGANGRRCWIDALKGDRIACERAGVVFPAEAESIIRQDWTAFEAAGPAALVGHATDAVIELQPARPPPPARPRLPAHAAAEPKCRACGCPATHHPSIASAVRCRSCSHPPASHWSTAPAVIYFGRARVPVCASYLPALAGDASDPCACGHCPMVQLAPTPTARRPAQEAPRR